MASQALSWSYPKPVTNNPFSIVSVLETRMDSPLQYAPFPIIAEYTFSAGSSTTTPKIGLLFCIQAIETPNDGYPCTKFVVPSSGSIIHLHSASILVSGRSSARIPKSGVSFIRSPHIMSSDSVSISVTRFVGPFFRMEEGSLSMMCLAADFAADSAMSSKSFRILFVEVVVNRLHKELFES